MLRTPCSAVTPCACACPLAGVDFDFDTRFARVSVFVCVFRLAKVSRLAMFSQAFRVLALLGLAACSCRCVLRVSPLFARLQIATLLDASRIEILQSCGPTQEQYQY